MLLHTYVLDGMYIFYGNICSFMAYLCTVQTQKCTYLCISYTICARQKRKETLSAVFKYFVIRILIARL